MVVTRKDNWQTLLARARNEPVPGVDVTRQVTARVAESRAGGRVAGVGVAGVAGLHGPTLAACAGVALVVAIVALKAGLMLGGGGDELGPVIEFLSLYRSPLS